MKKYLIGLIFVVSIIVVGLIGYGCGDNIAFEKSLVRGIQKCGEQGRALQEAGKELQRISEFNKEEITSTVVVTEGFDNIIGKRIPRDSVPNYIYENTGIIIQLPAILPDDLIWGDINVDRKQKRVIMFIGPKLKITDDVATKAMDVNAENTVGVMSVYKSKQENQGREFFSPEKVSINGVNITISYPREDKNKRIISFERNGSFYYLAVITKKELSNEYLLKIIEAFLL